MIRKYVLIIERRNDGQQKYVFASSSLSEVREYIDHKYRGSKRITPSVLELFKELIIDKYYYIIKRTANLQNDYILRIKAVDLNEEEEN